MKFCRGEATLDELLADPVTRAVMEADGVDPRELETMLREVAAFSRSVRKANQH